MLLMIKVWVPWGFPSKGACQLLAPLILLLLPALLRVLALRQRIWVQTPALPPAGGMNFSKSRHFSKPVSFSVKWA